MKYNRSLDFAALALQAAAKGKTELAAKLFVKASSQPDIEDALRIIEASNAKAFEVEAKAKEAKATEVKAKATKTEAAKRVKDMEVKAKATKTEAAKRVKASDDFVEDEVVDEVSDDELGADLVTDLGVEEGTEEETLAGDFDELEDVAGEDDSTAEEFAAVLASMRKASKK